MSLYSGPHSWIARKNIYLDDICSRNVLKAKNHTAFANIVNIASVQTENNPPAIFHNNTRLNIFYFSAPWIAWICRALSIEQFNVQSKRLTSNILHNVPSLVSTISLARVHSEMFVYNTILEKRLAKMIRYLKDIPRLCAHLFNMYDRNINHFYRFPNHVRSNRHIQWAHAFLKQRRLRKKPCANLHICVQFNSHFCYVLHNLKHYFGRMFCAWNRVYSMYMGSVRLNKTAEYVHCRWCSVVV